MDMTDEQFIGYCETHCTTERALFCKRDVLRIAKLAQLPNSVTEGISKHPREWYSLHSSMEEMCYKARKQLEKQKCIRTQ